ncbi:F-box/LRR-repeat protein 8-like [Erythrolamprus reginae]|uniref:F-box/LRR-repeat protein 8-like n=1 Tax=Erythrolamprus reginae TaxID=121349 RepID=UPI00396CDDD8
MGLGVSSQSLSRWIRDCIAEVYTARSQSPPAGVVAHSTRSAATSAAWSTQASLEEICRAATWASASTFICHYRLDFLASAEASFGRRVLQRSAKLQALCIICQGLSPYFYSGQNLLQSVRLLCQSNNRIHLQHINFQRMRFNNTLVLLASRNPNLCILLINNQDPRTIILNPEVIVEVISRQAHSRRIWGPYEQRMTPVLGEVRNCCHGDPCKLPGILKANIPMKSLQFNYLHYLTDDLRLITNFYSQMVETLLLYTTPYNALNASLIELAKKCCHLKEVHCYCMVSQDMVDAFLSRCSDLRNYTLSATLLSSMLPALCP